jgi:integrase
VPIPPALTGLLRRHLDTYGTAPDGRLFSAPRGGILHESYYGRTWHAARATALGPALATTPLARRPYDLRHAALSLWLASGAPPAQIAARAGHSIHVLLAVYTHCVPGHDQAASHAIERALDPPEPAAHPAGHRLTASVACGPRLARKTRRRPARPSPLATQPACHAP